MSLGVTERGWSRHERHIPVKSTPQLLAGGGVSALIAQRDATVFTALCSLEKVHEELTYSITPTGLDAIRAEGICDRCIIRAGLMAANDLVFTNGGLNSLLVLIEVFE